VLLGPRPNISMCIVGPLGEGVNPLGSIGLIGRLEGEREESLVWPELVPDDEMEYNLGMERGFFFVIELWTTGKFDGAVPLLNRKSEMFAAARWFLRSL